MPALVEGREFEAFGNKQGSASTADLFEICGEWLQDGVECSDIFSDICPDVEHWSGRNDYEIGQSFSL